MDFSDKLFILLYNTLNACFDQILWLWGPFFVIGFALYFVTRLRDRAFAESVGQKAELFLTGWIGTPVHEMGHAIFCVLFRHTITEAKFFSPDENGTLGYVKHEYNPKSSYQQIGNFFIGIAPMLFGTVVIYALLGILFPQYSETNWYVFKIFLNTDNFSDWRFWLFLYLSVGIASHMKLSAPDFKSAAGGFVTLLCLIFLVNLIANMFLTFGLKELTIAAWLTEKTDVLISLFYSIMLYALAVSILYLLFVYILWGLCKLVRKN